MDTLQEALRKYNENDAAFFKEAWSIGTPPPDDIREAAERIVRAYGIRGICDPGYIANVIAMCTGRGDGVGNFTQRAESD